MKNHRSSVRPSIRKSLAVGALSLSLVAQNLLSALPAVAGSAPVTTVAPNLMVIFGNSFSMNRTMDNLSYPDAANGKPIQTDCPGNYNSSSDYVPSPVFKNDPGCGTGTPYPYHQYGNQPDSKLYIAKQVLYNLLDSKASDNINFGFATFRQAMGLRLNVTKLLTNAFWPQVFPSNGTVDNPLPDKPDNLSSMTTQQLTDFANHPDNFAWTLWWPGWDSTRDHAFYIGKVKKGGKNQPNNKQVVSFTSTASGAPMTIQYPAGQKSPFYENNTTDGDYFYGSGGLDMGSPINAQPTDPEPAFNLCHPYYNSQANYFQASYIANNADGSPRLVVNNYPGQYQPSTVLYESLGSDQFDENGQMKQIWTDRCYDRSQRTIEQVTLQTSDTWSDGSPAYFSYIPQVLDQVNGSPVGAFTGWSGAASYDPSTNTYTANYPSGAQPATLMGSYNRSGAKTMGAFVDLPTPASGYTDNRQKIMNLINPAYPQWSDSGLGYDENTQTITDGGQQRSISASSMKGSYNPNQEPVYDSLMDAAAYFTAYNKQDKDADCRTNQILLIYDGHEDARYTYDNNGDVVYADPALAAKKLNDMGVKVNVVIISSNAGDITQANAIAAAGGTNQAFQVNTANDLLNAISSVFSSLQGAVVNASPAVPTQITAGSYTYSAVSNNASGSQEGHLYAYALDANGDASATPAFDAASPSVQAGRSSKMWSDVVDNGVQKATQWANLPSSVFAASSTPTAAQISSYTADPNYDRPTYLAGRKAGSMVGIMTSTAARPVYVAPPSNPLLLTKPGYTAFAQSLSSASPFVLWSANDGLLYSSNATNGALNWAYMPSPLLADLKNYSTFEASNPMDGGFRVVDGRDGSGNWHRFVIGTAKSGAVHYGFALKSDGTIDNGFPVMMDNQPGATSPDAAAPVVVWDADGVGYAIYTTTAGNQSKLSVIDSTGRITSANLSFTPSTPISVDQATGTLYMGTADGKVVFLTTANGFAASAIAGTYSSSTSLVGTMHNTSDPANYVGYATVQGIPYVFAAGEKQITVFTFGANGWTTAWWTNAGGQSANTDASGNAVTYSSDPGTTGTGPQYLPANGLITDAPVVFGGTLVVPVTQVAENTTLECGVGSASYYLYRMDSGAFPTGVFTGANGKPLTINPIIGVGVAYSPVISFNSQTGKLSLYGSSQQDGLGKSTIGKVLDLNAASPSGIIGIRNLMPTN